jgi:3-hydroxyisobutyrate dehydrogenase-like beta-hydroxyacid dehydrogenase
MATIAIIGAGAMGSGIGRQLADGGAKVLTYLDGRSPESHDRARAAGMEPAPLEDIVGAEIVLSIVPPGEAIGVAERLASAIGERPAPVTFIDCNAISPDTMRQVAAVFRPGQANVLDGSIIGLPPQPGKAGPKLYVSGDGADRSAVLAGHGLHVRRIGGAIGAASALKMCYAGINKGVTGLGTAMLLAAIGSGADQSLRREMAESNPDLDRKLSGAIPDMYAKAYRWVAEMEEIAAFLGEDDPASLIFKGMAGVFQKMADDRAGSGALAGQINDLLGR